MATTCYRAVRWSPSSVVLPVAADYPARRMTDDLTAILMRVEALERHNITDDADHVSFRTNDSQTATAVDKLAGAINDPRTGLIVEIANFRTEVANDRRVFKAWIAGAVAAIGAVFTVITLYAPVIQRALGIAP